MNSVEVQCFESYEYIDCFFIVEDKLSLGGEVKSLVIRVESWCMCSVKGIVAYTFNGKKELFKVQY